MSMPERPVLVTPSRLAWALRVFDAHGVAHHTVAAAAASVGIEEGLSTPEVVLLYADYLQGQHPSLGGSGDSE